MPNIGERTRAYVRDRGPTHRLDQYLTEQMPRLIREHELATEERIRPLDEQIGRHHDRIADLEGWRGASVRRLETIQKRLSRLEVKYGLGAR